MLGNSLSESDRAKVREHQLLNAAVSRKPDEAPSFGAMSDAALREWTLKNFEF
jgi:hypothetical protein